MIALLLKNWQMVAIGALVALLGLQSWRLDHLQGVHDLTLAELESVRHDRDQVAVVSEEHRQQLADAIAGHNQYVQMHQMDLLQARDAAAEAMARRDTLETALARERQSRRTIVAEDAECAELMTPICAAMEARIRDNRQ